MQDEIAEDIVSMIRSVTRNPDLVLDQNTDLNGLGIDSLDFVELLFLIEDKFGIDVPFNANAGQGDPPFKTVADVAEAVRMLVAGKSVTA